MLAGDSIRSCALIAFLLFAAGCSTVRSPQVTLQGVSVGGQTDEGFVLQFAVELSNPNSEPLQLWEIAYDVSVNGSRMYDGRRSAESTLAANGSTTLLLPAVVRYDQIGGEGAIPESMTYALGGKLWYLTNDALAEALFERGLRRPSIGFGASGRLTSR
ncbi:MAG: LEA type 2 family protein [Phycisphaeraceae bacterium]|nr:LEA type 2 family protein [Phycisphaerales bacterium]QOJ18123.1 MAG: LEA type 2 family protein [Phycisphaeraceae bacterium]